MMDMMIMQGRGSSEPDAFSRITPDFP